MQGLQQNKIGSKRLTGSTLKWIAMVTMIIDHIGAVILEQYIAAQPAPAEWLGMADKVLRYVGRLAFPIFCFLLVEGFFHTHDRKKYLLHLSVFAVLSDPAFDFSMVGSWFDLGLQNVFFTLAFGLLAVWCVDVCTEKGKPMLGWCGAILCCVVSYFAKTDYNYLGIALILTFYICRGKKSLYFAVPVVLFFGDIAQVFMLYYSWFASMSLEFFRLLLTNALQEVFGAFSLIFIAQYNGERGGKMPKYFFYVFYPAHLLLMAGVRFLLIGK